MSHETKITVVSDANQPIQENYEVSFDCMTFGDRGQVLMVRHNVCEGVSLEVEIRCKSGIYARSVFVLDDDDLDGMIAALQEAKRRMEAARVDSAVATVPIDSGSPILCEHANENPMFCPCTGECYCRQPGRMCANRGWLGARRGV